MRTIYYQSGFQAPVVHWRDSHHGAFQAAPMPWAGNGQNPWESLWEVQLFTANSVQFYVEDHKGRDPVRRHYEFTTAMIFLQDGQLFSYRPAAHVEGPRRAYDPANAP